MKLSKALRALEEGAQQPRQHSSLDDCMATLRKALDDYDGELTLTFHEFLALRRKGRIIASFPLPRSGTFSNIPTDHERTISKLPNSTYRLAATVQKDIYFQGMAATDRRGLFPEQAFEQLPDTLEEFWQIYNKDFCVRPAPPPVY